jgi:predicted site-specific integrase-resolvase
MAQQLRYKISEAARLLGMSVWTLRRWVYSGKAPSIKTQTGTVFIPAQWVNVQAGITNKENMCPFCGQSLQKQ